MCIVCLTGAVIIEAYVFGDVGTDAYILQLAFGCYFLSKAFPSILCDSDIAFIDPSLVHRMGYGVYEHGRDRSLQVGVGSVQDLVPESADVLVAGEAFDLAKQQPDELS